MMVLAESIGLAIKCGAYAYIVIASSASDVTAIESSKPGGNFSLAYANSERNTRIDSLYSSSSYKNFPSSSPPQTRDSDTTN